MITYVQLLGKRKMSVKLLKGAQWRWQIIKGTVGNLGVSHVPEQNNQNGCHWYRHWPGEMYTRNGSMSFIFPQIQFFKNSK
uniref:Putative RNA-dependent DNA polymerase n=1 Tax=Erythrocytic necrosis virus TaxID=1543320 RepID=A0A4D6QIA4_9VIRU|nr:putative RNA-dependent DNA polymerase [Erythrocytic necrosis virus]